MPKAFVNSIWINYAIYGPEKGEWLVLINGLADDLQTWSSFIPKFADTYRILAFDNRGIGRSSRPPGPYTTEIMAADLHALLLELQIDNIHLLGVSMGGMIAQSYALNYPNYSEAAKGRRMISLSLCCTYARPGLLCERMFDLWADMATKMSVQDVMRDVTLWAFTPDLFKHHRDKLKEVDDAMQNLDMSLEAYLAQLNVIRQFDSMDALRELAKNGKTLGGIDDDESHRIMVLVGEEDHLIPVEQSDELCTEIPGSVWRTTTGGHGCMVGSITSGDEMGFNILSY